jgi:hypothetical protein
MPIRLLLPLPQMLIDAVWVISVAKMFGGLITSGSLHPMGERDVTNATLAFWILQYCFVVARLSSVPDPG